MGDIHRQRVIIGWARDDVKLRLVCFVAAAADNDDNYVLKVVCPPNSSWDAAESEKL